MPIPYERQTGNHTSLYGQDLIEKLKVIDEQNENSQSLYEFILDNMTEGVFIVQNEIIKYTNKYAEVIFGVPRERMIGMNGFDLVHPDDIVRIRDIHKRRMNGEIKKTNYELRMIDTQKNTIYVLAHTVTITWDGKPAALQFIVDITEREKKEQELKNAYDIINQSTSVMFIWENSNGWPVTFVTRNVKDLLGYTAEEFLTKKVLFVNLIHADDIEKAKEEVKRYSEDKTVTRIMHEPYRIVTKTGDIRWIEDKTVIDRDKDGNVIRYQGILQDITKRKMVENDRERVINELKDALAEIKTLEGLIPICSYCKSIRNDEGYWNGIEEYVSKKKNAYFSHGICPSCLEKLYPEITTNGTSSTENEKSEQESWFAGDKRGERWSDRTANFGCQDGHDDLQQTGQGHGEKHAHDAPDIRTGEHKEYNE